MFDRPIDNYGIDAPLIIIFFFLLGSILLVSTYVLHAYLSSSLIVQIFVFLMGSFALYWILAAVLMVFSSKYGKLKVIKDLIASLNMTGDEKILDVGCGRGILLIEAAKKLNFGKAVGIDIWRQQDQSKNSKQMTLQNAQAAQVAHRIDIITCDMTEMFFEDDTFDYVVSSLAIHNVNKKIEREKALQEIARVLKPGGIAKLLDFQHTKEYALFFQKLGFENVLISTRDYRMFPPVRIVTIQKSLPTAF